MADDRGPYKLEYMKVPEPREPMSKGDWNGIKAFATATEVIALPVLGFVADIASGGGAGEAFIVAGIAGGGGVLLAGITLRWGIKKDYRDSEGFGLWTNR